MRLGTGTLRRTVGCAVLAAGIFLISAEPALAAPARHHSHAAARTRVTHSAQPLPAAASDPLVGLLTGAQDAAAQLLAQAKAAAQQLGLGLTPTTSGRGASPSPTPTSPVSAPTRPAPTSAPSTRPVAAPTPSSARSTVIPTSPTRTAKPARIAKPARTAKPVQTAKPAAASSPAATSNAPSIAGAVAKPSTSSVRELSTTASTPAPPPSASASQVVALPQGRTPVDVLADPIELLGAALGVGALPIVLLGLVAAAGLTVVVAGTRRSARRG